MTGTEITGAIIGFLLCALIVCIIAFLVIVLIWWMFRKDMDFDDIANYMEGPENSDII
jgi:hypothetical protein